MTGRGFLSGEYVAEARPLRGAWLQLMLFFLASALSASALFFLTAGQARAAGPHGPFDSTTEKCEKCHALHTARSGPTTLLNQADTAALCESCHSGGAGADTAVMQGSFMRPATSGGTGYVVTGTLLGGGFNAVGGVSDTTSLHTIGSMAVPPGSADMGASVSLACTSCHTPHNGPNYRLLRRNVNGSGTDMSVTWNGPYPQPDGTLDGAYDERDLGADTGTQYLTFNYRGGMSAWCSACHSMYMTRQDSTPYDAGDIEGAQVRFRHAVDVPVISTSPNRFNGKLYGLSTDLPLQDVNGNGRDGVDTITCLTCHRAHGSSAVMAEETMLSAGGDRGSLPSGTDSMLLRLDNREICQIACHKVVN